MEAGEKEVVNTISNGGQYIQKGIPLFKTGAKLNTAMQFEV